VLTTNCFQHGILLMRVGVSCKWIVPVGPGPLVIEDGLIVFDKQTGLIEYVGTSEACDLLVDELHSLPGDQMIIPGLINMHSHSPMALLRGYSDDLPLRDWLAQVWRAEAAFVDEDFVKVGTAVAVHEMLKTGTTTFCDNYFKSVASLQIARAAGIRMAGGEALICGPEDSEETRAGQLHAIRAAHGIFKSGEFDLSSFSVLTPHACYTVDEKMLREIKLISDTFSTRVQMHLHETEFEVSNFQETNGETPIQRLDRLGLLNDRLIAAHCVVLSPGDVSLLAARRVSVVTCPRSNLKLSSGICNVPALLAAGVNVAIGTDGCCSNNSLDMLADMQLVALLGKHISKDPRAVSCEQVLRMATLNGARALGVGDRLGSLEIGKLCDMVSLDFNDVAAQPVLRPLSSLVHTSGKKVSNVWIGGRQVVTAGEVVSLTVDKAKVDFYRELLIKHMV